MTHQIESNRFSELVQVLAEEGFDGMAQAMQLLLNEVMKIERSVALGAEPYERSAERRGYANGFKPKTVKTRVGELQLQVPQTRGVEFYPSSLEKGVRSERALKLAVAEMYVQGVSTRKVAKIAQELCEIPLETPRDRDGTFEPKIVEKHQRRIPDFDEKILALYAKGMTTRDTQEIVQQLYGVEVSAQLVSEVTADLDADVTAWRNRSLEAVWPLVYFDGLVVHVRGENRRVSQHTVYVALGVNLEGKKELLGLWLAPNEGAKFWLACLTDLKNRGLSDIITLFDFPPAIRRAIYTTNAIESVNSVIRKFTKNRKIYPNEESALKLIYMAIHEASKRWTMPIHHWKQALNHFAILYEDPLPELT